MKTGLRTHRRAAAFAVGADFATLSTIDARARWRPAPARTQSSAGEPDPSTHHPHRARGGIGGRAVRGSRRLASVVSYPRLSITITTRVGRTQQPIVRADRGSSSASRHLRAQDAEVRRASAIPGHRGGESHAAPHKNCRAVRGAKRSYAGFPQLAINCRIPRKFANRAVASSRVSVKTEKCPALSRH